MKKDEDLKEILEVSRAMATGDFTKEFKQELEGKLGTLAQYIDKTRKSLFEISPLIADASSKEMPTASAQLSDLVETIDSAANKLLDLTEEVVGHSNRMNSLVNELKAEIEKVPDVPPTVKGILMEMDITNKAAKDDFLEMLASLSFQDFTGQKLKKVILTLEDVERKLLEFILLFGVKLDGGKNELKKEEMIKRLTDESKPLDLKQDVVDEIFQDLGL